MISSYSVLVEITCNYPGLFKKKKKHIIPLLSEHNPNEGDTKFFEETFADFLNAVYEKGFLIFRVPGSLDTIHILAEDIMEMRVIGNSTIIRQYLPEENKLGKNVIPISKAR